MIVFAPETGMIRATAFVLAMEKYQRDMCALIRGSGARVGNLPSARIRDLWREWSLVECTLAWAMADREHVRWFLAWVEKRPALLVAPTRVKSGRGSVAEPVKRRKTPANRPEKGAEDKLPLLMERISGQPGAWLRLTGLKPREFQRHLEMFVAVWEDHNRSRTVRGRHRQKNGRGGRKGAGFGPREMFFFILFYYRHYPMQKAMASLFGLTQQWASLWIKHLTPIAQSVLHRRLAPPPRKPATLEQLLAVEPLVHLIAEPRQLSPEQRAGLENLARLRAELP